MLVASPALATPGSRLWVERYNGQANKRDRAAALGVSPDGSTVFVTGFSNGSATGPDYATVAYDASTGAKLWATRYNGPANKKDEATALGVSSDGSTVFVTGFSIGTTLGYDYATVAYDASTGAELWTERYDGPSSLDDEALALGVSPDGSAVFVTGVSHGSTTASDYATVAYNASTGAKLWVKRYANGMASALAVSPDGATLFVTGRSYGSTTGYDYATVAYDAPTGAKLWATRYNGPANSDDEASALGVSPDGRTVFVTGFSDGSTTGNDYATVAYDASTGAELWVKRYTNGPSSLDDEASALGVSPDGRTVFVTGRSDGSTTGTTGNNYATVAYDPSTGARLWVKRYTDNPANSDDEATALGVSPNDSAVFVTGFSYGSTTGYDYATVAYNASTGSQLWVKRYQGFSGDFDEATALGVSPNGSAVFLTGFSYGSTTGYDYATLAYTI